MREREPERAIKIQRKSERAFNLKFQIQPDKDKDKDKILDKVKFPILPRLLYRVFF